MIEVIFNLIGSEIHDTDQWKLYTGSFDKEKDPNAYLNFELFCAKDVIEWCQRNNMDFKVIDANYAMQIAFIFKEDSDALAFKLRWI